MFSRVPTMPGGGCAPLRIDVPVFHTRRTTDDVSKFKNPKTLRHPAMPHPQGGVMGHFGDRWDYSFGGLLNR
jgi:hypothetical protein